MYSLSKAGQTGPRLDAHGFSYGAIPLVARQPDGKFAPCRSREAGIAKRSLGFEDGGLLAVARALNVGDIGRAQIAALHMRLPVFEAEEVAKLLRKANFDPDQPRDDHGRWTDEGSGDDSDRKDTDASPSDHDSASENSSHSDAGAVSEDAHSQNAPDGTAQNAIYKPDGENLLNEAGYNGYFHDLVVQDVINDLKTNNVPVIPNVRLTSLDGTTAVADMLIQLPGYDPCIVEVKTGENPTFTNSQRWVYPLAQVGGHVSSMDGRIAALGLSTGSPLPPLRVEIIYQKDENSPRETYELPYPHIYDPSTP